MVPLHQTTPQSGGGHLVLVPVPGAVVLFVCLLLIAACVAWLGLLLHQGVEKDREG